MEIRFAAHEGASRIEAKPEQLRSEKLTLVKQ
jgi:hypothetical protein